MLQAIKQASDHPVEMVSTYQTLLFHLFVHFPFLYLSLFFPFFGLDPSYLGAHSVPKGSTAQEYKDEIINNILPKIKVLEATFHLIVLSTVINP